VSDADEALGSQALQLFVAWLTGDRLTARADEAERRWRAARQWHDLTAAEADPELAVRDRFLALSNVELPASHPERDDAFALSLFERHLERSLAIQHVGEAIRTVGNLLSSDLVSPDRGEELLALGADLLESADEAGGEEFLLAAEHFSRGRFITARDAGRSDEAARWAQRTRLYSGIDEESEDLDVSQLASLASQYHMEGDDERAADCYRQIVEKIGLDENPPVQQFALEEATLRFLAGDSERAAQAAEELLPFVEATYLTAVLDADVADSASRLKEVVDLLAHAQAELARWDDVVRTLDRSTGLRLRYRAALREHGDAAGIVKLERELDAATRGAATGDEDGVSVRARLLEEYRRVRAALPAGRIDSPSSGEMVAALEPDEAVAMVATTSECTLVAVVAAGSSAATGSVDYDWGWDDVLARLARDGDNGWLAALLDPDPPDPEEALRWMLSQLDAGPVRQIRELLPDGIRRLTLIPHAALTLIPWWAAGGFERMQVVIGPSASEFMRVRTARVAPAARSALMVANPTLDLAASALGCDVAEDTLRTAGFDVAVVSGEDANEQHFVPALQGRSILHFAGHGRMEARRSALELNPGRLGDAPFERWAASVTEWRDVVYDDEEDEEPAEPDEDEPTQRWADVEGVGRLTERHGPGDQLERVLERREGTLAASYAGERVVRVSELWSATDILVGDTMDSCRLAVLCACQSAAGGGRGDETPSLPAAFALAGVDTVIGSLWRVEEPLAVLWVDCFYELLAEAVGDDAVGVDVAALVKQVGDDLRAMDRDAARTRLFALIEKSDDPLVRLELEAYAEWIGERPFADAWRWASFYVAGHPMITFAAREP
jgi:hypothetical protein